MYVQIRQEGAAHLRLKLLSHNADRASYWDNIR